MVLDVNILPIEELESRIEEIRSEILYLWLQNPGHANYYIQCSCGYECDHIGENIIPRVRLQGCYHIILYTNHSLKDMDSTPFGCV